ncbi:hypothetical protein [Flavobacterium sp. FlaQc-30]|uniref:hypothetical protein n=1 Tax=Flavobacterium sp. FlaQc-30 TaxID=3374179 RepID=UPI0037571F0B
MKKELFQYATVKIKCKEETGTALLYSPGEAFDYIYVFTAKHCLVGENFDQDFVNEDITIEKIFNPADNTWHSYTVSQTDKIVCTSSNELDLALIIIPKTNIEELSGVKCFFPIIDRASLTGECLIRGFADFNSGQEDRPYELNFEEYSKDNKNLFSLNFDGSLDTRYQSAVSNVQGLSGSGVFTLIKDNLYLMGILHTYEEKSRFFATAIMTYNHLVPEGFEKLATVNPEEDDAVIDAFDKIEANRSAVDIKTRDTIGEVHIARDMKRPLQILTNSSMLVLYGKAGTGKSAMAKTVLNELEKSAQTAVIAFTAEQLAAPSLHEALLKAGYGVSIQQIIESPLAGKRVVFWIESFEKLAESGFGGAFTELLALVKKNLRIGMVVTIRDYMLQKFKIFYNHEFPGLDIFYQISEFNEQEMMQIKASLPQISPLLKNQKLTHLLCTPYYLDKALRIYPMVKDAESLDEAGFKKLMWEEIIEAGDSNRGAAFAAIALKRAKAMELYTFYEPDHNTQALIQDNIIYAEPGELQNRFSPSHDILEDWALVRYIKQERQKAQKEEDFLSGLDSSPAVRRAFRLWLEDFYTEHPSDADDFSRSVLLSVTVGDSWKNELRIYILRSENASGVFYSLKEHLLEDNARQLFHVIYLLRTCCKNIREAGDLDDLIPLGSGWDAAIDFVLANKDVLYAIPQMQESVLELIFDWALQLAEFNPVVLPAGSQSAAVLLEDHLIRHQDAFSDYSRSTIPKNDFKKALKIFLKLTSKAQPAVKKLLDAIVDPHNKDSEWHHKGMLEYAKELIIEDVSGEQICRFYPEIVLSEAVQTWIEKKREPRPGSLISMLEIERGPGYWGLSDDIDYDSSSAYRTFFYWMFLYHPDKAVLFLTSFLNDAFKKNYEARARDFDQRKEIELQFQEHGSRSYYGSLEYWTLYRGANASNMLISSLLMGLEKGLLDLASNGLDSDKKVMELNEQLVLNTNNSAVLAVVSSVVQAYPGLLDSITAVLLGNRQLLEWDSSRYATDLMGQNFYYGSDLFLKKERIAADKELHRTAYRRGLIGFAANYVFSCRTMNLQIFEQLDVLWKEIPQADASWRKALFEMDLRKYKFKTVDVPGTKGVIEISPGYDTEIEASINDIQGMSFPEIGTVWASQAFKRQETGDISYASWKKGYDYLQGRDAAFDIMTAPGKMACLGLRDYFDELSGEEKGWCHRKLISLGSELAQNNPGFDTDLTTSLIDKEAVLYGIPLLFKVALDKEAETQVRALVFQLLTARIENRFKHYLYISISENLWKLRPEFSLNCWYGLFEYLEKSNADFNSRSVYFFASEKDKNPLWKEQLQSAVVADEPFITSSAIPELDHASRWHLDGILEMIAADTEMKEQKQFIAGMLSQHLSQLEFQQRNYDEFFECREVFKKFYSKYLLQCPRPYAEELFVQLLDLTLIGPERKDGLKDLLYIKDILKQLILEVIFADSESQTVKQFWFLWHKLRDWILSSGRIFLISVLLLDIDWNVHREKWDNLKGEEQFYKDFITKYGSYAVNESIDLLAGAGFRNFMPHSVSWMAALLRTDLNDAPINRKLERFVHRAFFNYAAKIKGSTVLNKDFLYLLDLLIAKGSPKAYILKEEMIQFK